MCIGFRICSHASMQVRKLSWYLTSPCATSVLMSSGHYGGEVGGLEVGSHLYYQAVFKESSVLSILNLHNAINKSSKPLLSQTKNIYVLTCIAPGCTI